MCSKFEYTCNDLVCMKSTAKAFQMVIAPGLLARKYEQNGLVISHTVL